jgi:hypothetical protein
MPTDYPVSFGRGQRNSRRGLYDREPRLSMVLVRVGSVPPVQATELSSGLTVSPRLIRLRSYWGTHLDIGP